MSEKYPQLVSRFLRYVKVDTRSDEDSQTVPSSPKEVQFLKDLAVELKEVGLENVRTMKDGYLFAELPSNLPDGQGTKVGFISHVDTADFESEHVNPQEVDNYDGHSVLELGTSGFKLDPAVFPNLKNYQGHDLITTDGTTLLGSDDKSGVAEIVSLIEYLIAHPEIKHGPVRVAFGPDEEIGIGANNFDVAAFDADFAYTVDGGPLGELEWETFNAAQAEIVITGQNVHPGTAKGAMVNALQVAIDFHNALPEHDRPEKTEGREGFYHLIDMAGTPEEAKLTYIIRDHDHDTFENRKATMTQIADQLNKDLHKDRVALTLKDQYYNMGDVLKDHQEVVDYAEEAMTDLGIKPITDPARGGTDGSKITFLGLPTPNLFAGGENMHGRYEFVSKQVMEQATDVLLGILQKAAK
ncbi:peptidase T [Fructobacillus pseudoficulneus]|uniref:Peptidase T n=1 Tax=Fructobacillus pseudoficulneus TaxID=220714 RepID=A0A3F3GQV5_9LACO|nr:peptidase T [Fructobacillus pseudoficulneus]GAP02156.1 peptidase T [Fructobacillus pseudoficulneus]SEH35923.1 tripeptide aminopeptidase [Fructobacillus pseudoficulneus]